MKKIHMIVALLAMMLPTVLWAGGGSTTYYAALKAQVSSNSSGWGKVYAGTSNSLGAYATPSSQSPNQSSTTQNDEKTFYAFAQANDGYEFSHWSTSDNGTSASTANPYSVKVKCSSSTESSPTLTTVYANFKKKVLAAFGITFETSSAGTYTVDGAAPANKTGLTEATQVVLASSDPNFLSWNINGTVVNNNPYTATCTANTTISAAFLTADQVTSVTTLAELNSALANNAYKKITIPSGTKILVPSGTTVTVPSGTQLVIDGALNVVGTVSNNGTISGNGTLYKVSVHITQGDVIVLRNAAGGECAKYCETSVSQNTPSLTGNPVSCGESWAALLNGETAYAITKQSPKAIKVNLNTSAAANKISSIAADSTDSPNGVDKITENGSYVLVGETNLDGPIKPDSSNKYKRLTFSGNIDCAKNKLKSYRAQQGNGSSASLFNGDVELDPSKYTSGDETYKSGAYLQGFTAKFYACSSVKLTKLKNGNPLYFYGCGTSASPATVTKTKYDDTGFNKGTSYFYCGYYTYSFSSAQDVGTSVYGGSFTSNPDGFIKDAKDANGVDVTLSYKYDGSKYYVVQPDTGGGAVARTGGVEYETLGEAIENATSGGLVELIGNVNLYGASLEIAANRNVTVCLTKKKVENGTIVNRGVLVFTDSSTPAGNRNSDESGGIVACDIENHGTFDVVFGLYSGAVVNKAGTSTIHNGLFTGSLRKDGGVVSVKGGHFKDSSFTAAALSEFMVDGYKIFQYNGYRSVCELPNGELTPATVSGLSGYSATPYATADYNLLKGWTNKKARSDYSVANWTRLAELLPFYQVFNDYKLDPTLVFDRKVRAGSLSIKAGTGTMGQDVDIESDIGAGVRYRALTEYLTSGGYTAKTYKALFTEGFSSVSVAVRDGGTGVNNGTICSIQPEVWNSSPLYIFGKTFFTIGAGSNKAMIRPAEGAATFYATPAAAMNAVADGGTIMLANDCDAALPLTKPGTYTFDTMGFAYSGGEPVLGSSLMIQAQTSVDSAAKVIRPEATATVYVVVENVQTRTIPVPTAVSGLVYDGTVKTGVAPGTGYTLSGNTAIAAGTYTATATLEANYEWSDGTTAAKTISWSIGKAPLTITVANKTVVRGNTVAYTLSYDGFVGEEDESALTTEATVSSEYDPAATDGAATYAITATGAASGNYAISYVPGTLTVVPAVAKIGGTFYAALADALGSVTDANAATITLLADVSGDGIIVPSSRNITIDFGGFTCTMNGEPIAGSTGSETYAFQLLQGSTVKFMNGTIYSANALTLVQNYANLTLEGMTLTLNNAECNGAYTLSNNNGTTTIKNTTINANPTTGSVAFGVRRCSSYPSVSVTVTGSSTINGDVEVSVDDNDVKEGATLMLDGGTVTGGIKMSAGAEFATVREKDAFSQAAPAGYVWVSDGENTGTSTLRKLYTVKFVDQQGNTYANGEFSLPAGTPAAEIAAKAATVAVTMPEGYIGYGWSPVFEAIAADQTYAVVFTLGSKFIYSVGDGGVKIDREWYDAYVKPNVANAPAVTDGTQPGSDAFAGAAAALSTMAPNGVRYWQNYVLGLTGAADEKFTIRGAAPETEEKTGDPTGNYVIIGELSVPTGWEATDVKVGTANAKSGYTVNANYKLVVRNADGTFSELEDVVPVPVTSAAPELLVPMDVAANKSLAIVIEITVEPAG